jgi:hypothetical protein
MFIATNESIQNSVKKSFGLTPSFVVVYIDATIYYYANGLITKSFFKGL